MTYETYRIIFIAGLIGCLVMLAVSVLLFFLFGIPRVIGDLSGHTARRAISDIRQRSENGERAPRSVFSSGHSRVTDRITRSGNIAPAEGGTQTALITAQNNAAPAAETSLLDEGTMLLSEDTSLLEPEIAAPVMETAPVFEVEYEITYIHTNEIITGAE